MNDYDVKYEEYKKSLFQNHWFIKTLHEKYHGSITAEEEYIDRNGVLWKVGILGAVCGFCIAFTPIENGNWVLGIVLFLAMIGSLIWARHIGKKFKKDLGEMIFYAFRYHKHFTDKIQEDKNEKMKGLMEDLFKTISTIQYRAKVSKSRPEVDMDEVIALLQFIENMENYKQRYEDISKYDWFAGSLKNDYYFNAEIQKDIDKYI